MKKHLFLDFNYRKVFNFYEANLVLFKYIKTAQKKNTKINQKIMLQAAYNLQKLKLYKYRAANFCTFSGRSRATYLNLLSRHKFLDYQAQGLLFGWKKN